MVRKLEHTMHERDRDTHTQTPHDGMGCGYA